MDLFYEDGLHLIKEGNELLAKEIMILYKELSSRVYNPTSLSLCTPRISYENMRSYYYKTDDFLPLPSNESSGQSCILVPMSYSKVVSFSNMFNLLLFEKKISLYVLLKRICFPFN